MKLLHRLLELLFPRKCVLCQILLPSEQTDLCRDCRSVVPEWNRGGRILPGIESYAAVWYYEDQVRDSLLRFKFSGKRYYARAYGRLLAMAIHRELPEADLITWVPVSGIRRHFRGYDQSRLLAREAGRELMMKPLPLLKKTRHNQAQSGISDPSLRRENVRGKYRAIHPEQLRGKRIILVDDILTTGATACECARILRAAGAKQVYLAVMAAGKDRNTNRK
ncbi:MAG: ComF family protein [Oscillospiraceae bacterium]|nr:ComF family protein [Oscillospiraceae bacterium]